MRRIAATALTLALLAAASAAATTRTLEGEFNGDLESSVALRVKHAHGEWFVRAFAAKQILISCQEVMEARLSSASINGLAPVNDQGRFKIRGTNEGQRVRVSGRLLNRRTARGSFRYSGPTEVDGETLACDSGGLGWTATR